MPDRREAIFIASTNASRPSKKRILTVCVKLFLEQGYKKTTVAQIVQQASVSNSIFQNIFRAKDGVLTELAQSMLSNQFAMARSTAGTQLPPIYVYAVDTAIQMTLTELNENLREIYIEAYTQKEASDYIFRETAKELYQIFSPYQPELTEQDFYFMEIGSAGIMRGFMAHPCDEALTLEKKLRTFLTMSLRSYHSRRTRSKRPWTSSAAWTSAPSPSASCTSCSRPLPCALNSHCNNLERGRCALQRPRFCYDPSSIESITRTSARCCAGDRRSHLSSISRCPAVRASSVSPSAKNCESVSPNASQIFSSEENEGVMPFWYQDEW